MEAVGTGAAANVSSEIAKGTFQEIKRHIRHVFIYKKNVDKFEEKLQMLIAKRTSVQQEVDAADRNGEKIKADVQHWSNTVDKVINEEEKKVKDLQEKAKNKCFIGLCPNIKSRYQLSRKAEEGVAVVDDLIRQCQFNEVGYRGVPEDQVAQLLSLRLEDKSTVVRAHRLCERLKKGKKVLVVLDNTWKELDLEKVRIPFGNQHKGCKILLTSRDQNVLTNEMDAEKTFAIGDKEDWLLFRKTAGEIVESTELRSTAIEVAKRCAKLPLAIATVARALRNKSLYAWNDALRLLHCDSIDYLLRYAIGLGLTNGVNTVEEARNRLLTMVSNSCFLLDSNINDQYFDMHDLVFDVAMSIAFTYNQVFALNEEDVLKDWPDGETMKKWNKICLKYHRVGEVPDKLNCPQLVLFLICRKDLSMKMPPNFFRETTNLKVLDLTQMHFSSLPSSICLLTSLRTLCLDQCELGDIVIIGELKNLEILSL
ncbi:PREDICTED: probable disease resistance protein At4g27220 [Theobroma cacao]|uniref:Probable disease resistance protein At4g27220 n=1 Tax=Theobroma cacao TaxID=3641 RepID=A0AB32WCY5_THECC|nr:PREDICTED: probable disease resistance protein At4g27220 [Theobroma cacao]